MSDQNLEQSILSSHKTGIKGLLSINNYTEILYARVNIAAIVISLIVTVVGLCLKVNQYNIIVEVTNTLLGFLPGILGFTIAGFTLMVGFLQADLIESITQKPEKGEFTLYQVIVSKFALGVLIQGIALIIGYTFHFIIFYESKVHIELNEGLKNCLNVFSVFIMFYVFLLSIFIICQVIVNIFNFSQLFHFVVVKKRLDSKNKPSDNNQ